MPVELRETGSVLVPARKEEVLAILQRTLHEGAMVSPDRLEGAHGSWIVRETGNGTRVIHARRERAGMTTLARERDVLRRAVEADLFRLQKHFDVAPRP